MIKKHQYESSYRDVDFVLAISEHMKQTAIRNGLDKTIHVMPNGVDVGRFNRREVAPAYESTILCVMNFDVPEKVKTLNAFFEEYRERSLEHPILVLGDGYNLKQTMKHVERLGLQSQVQFRGHVNDIENYYSGCKVLVHPSGLESFGMVLLEAGACARGEKLNESIKRLYGNDPPDWVVSNRADLKEYKAYGSPRSDRPYGMVMTLADLHVDPQEWVRVANNGYDITLMRYLYSPYVKKSLLGR